MATKKAQVVKVAVYKDAAGEYRWRGLAANNKTVSEGGEGYNSRAYAMKMARELHPSTTVEYWG